jgi:DNA-3-methyladenine glycosylase
MEGEFFNRDAEIVAMDLLGKALVRVVDGKRHKARIVETEAYYDEKDPASRACQNGDLRKTMKMEAGTILVYGVHNNWLLNIVTGKEGSAEAVLIRAVEPVNFNGRGKGPGLLTKALFIGKNFHKQSIVNNKEIWLEDSDEKNFEFVKSFRIGVREDLPKKLRFYIKDNDHVSKK